MNRELTYTDQERNREYRIADGELPFFMHRERGLHLDEPDVTIDGQPVPAAILVLLGFLLLMNALAIFLRQRLERTW